MDTIVLHHHGRLVALACRRRVWLAPHVEAWPDGHPRKRLIAFMALYARDVLTGELSGPYTDEDAERFARLALIEPEIIKAHPRKSDAQLARLLGVPIDQLAAYLGDDLAALNAPRPRTRRCGGRVRRHRYPLQS